MKTTRAEKRTLGPRWVLIAAVGTLLLGAALARLGLEPPAALPADAPAGAFSAGRAVGELEALLDGLGPHPVGTQANAEMRRRLVARLEALGLQPEVVPGFACDDGYCAVVHNVVAELPGRSSERVLLAAHYDSVGAGPGAADDGAGVAALLETARAMLADGPHEHGVTLLFTDGEEEGLLGARAFFADGARARSFRAAVNLEARGVAGPSMMFETAGPTAPLASLFAGAVERPVSSSLFAAVYEQLENDTDFTVFREQGIAGYNLAFIERVRFYHTARDDLAHLDRESLQHQGDNALSLGRALARESELSAMLRGEEQAVWFDAIGVAIVGWPRGWSLPLALVALALLVVQGVGIARQHGRAFVRGWLACAAMPLAAILLGAVIGLVAVGPLSSEGRPGLSWGANGPPAFAMIWLGAAAPCFVWAWVAGRRIDPWVHHLGVWTLLSLAGVVVAWVAPWASHLLVVPTLAAALLAAALRAHRLRPDGAGFLLVVLLPVLVTALVWYRLAFGLAQALGPSGHFALSAALALPCLAALPALSRFEPRLGYSFAPFALAIAALFATSALLPRHGTDHPRRINVAHFQLEGEPAAQWWIDVGKDAAPAELLQLAEAGAPVPGPLPLDAYARVAVGPAPRRDAPAPEIERLETGAGRLRLRLRSPRGAPVLALLWPTTEAVPLVHVEAAGERRSIAPEMVGRGRWNGHAFVAVAGGPPEGVVIDLAPAPGPVFVLDIAYGLAAAEALLAARDRSAMPFREGDLSIMGRALLAEQR